MILQETTRCVAKKITPQLSWTTLTNKSAHTTKIDFFRKQFFVKLKRTRILLFKLPTNKNQLKFERSKQF